MLGLPPQGEATRLLLVRHGDTDVSMRGRCFGRLDVGLSGEGRRQASELRTSLRAVPLAAVGSSPLVRALDTAEAIARPHGLRPLALDALREIDFGELEGLTYDEIRAERPDLYREWMESPATVRFPGGESFADLRARVLPAVSEIVERHRGEVVAVVAHGGVVRVVLADALGLADGAAFRLGLACGGLSVVDWWEGAAVVQAVNVVLTEHVHILAGMTPPATAVVLTVGNEIVYGDVENTNASWLARRLAELGLEVRLLAAVRDSVEEVAAFLRAEMGRVGVVIVTGGLGGTPDDLTREAVAEAFGVSTEEIPELAAALRERFGPRGLGEYAAKWARIPRGAVPLDNPLGGAPGFVLGNVHVLPGLPREMEAMFETLADRFRGEPIGAWRRRYATGEGQIVAVLEEATQRHPAVTVGSYPFFLDTGPEVEVVLKSADAQALGAAAAWVEAALEERVGR
jgi:molybdenum cofactor synthesis domain-containing protein